MTIPKIAIQQINNISKQLKNAKAANYILKADTVEMQYKLLNRIWNDEDTQRMEQGNNVKNTKERRLKWM